eukprot:jgi/Picre1/32861/NNA_008190.t1
MNESIKSIQNLLLSPNKLPLCPPASAGKVNDRTVVAAMTKVPKTNGAPGKNGSDESDCVNILNRYANASGPIPLAIDRAPYKAPCTEPCSCSSELFALILDTVGNVTDENDPRNTALSACHFFVDQINMNC